MTENGTFRLRLTSPELKFLIQVLEGVVESSEMIIGCLDKKDRRLVEERRRRYVAKEMIRRFSGTLEGRKMHMRSLALILCNMITTETS
jgi:hypothetical protein